jgi:hypothetical protein
MKMKKEEAIAMLQNADRSDLPAAINKILTRKQAVEIVEKGIINQKDGVDINPLFEKRVYQVCRNQKRPKY